MIATRDLKKDWGNFQREKKMKYLSVHSLFFPSNCFLIRLACKIMALMGLLLQVSYGPRRLVLLIMRVCYESSFFQALCLALIKL